MTITDTSVSPFERKSRFAFLALVINYTGLLLVLALSTLLNPPQTDSQGAVMWLSGLGIVVFKTLPLLLFVPGLMARSHKAATWLAYLVQLYFVLAVMLIFTPGSGPWGWLMTLTSLGIFASALLFTRWQRRLEAGL